MSGRVRIGLVGPSSHAITRLLPALRLVDRAELSTVCSRDAAKASGVAARFSAASSTTSLEDLLQSNAVDALIVTGPPELHLRVVRACIVGGVPVYSEKPLGYRRSDIDELIEVEAGVPEPLVFVGYNFAFASTLSHLLAALRERAELQSARIRLVSNKPANVMWRCSTVAESILLVAGVHAIAIAVMTFGTPAKVRAMSTSYGGWRLKLDVWLGFAGGKTAVLELGNHAAEFCIESEWACVDGTAGVTGNLRRTTITEPNTHVTRSLGPSMSYATSDEAGYIGALTSFATSVADNKPSQSPLSLSKAVHETVDAIKSALEGHEPPNK